MSSHLFQTQQPAFLLPPATRNKGKAATTRKPARSMGPKTGRGAPILPPPEGLVIDDRLWLDLTNQERQNLKKRFARIKGTGRDGTTAKPYIYMPVKAPSGRRKTLGSLFPVPPSAAKGGSESTPVYGSEQSLVQDQQVDAVEQGAGAADTAPNCSAPRVDNADNQADDEGHDAEETNMPLNYEEMQDNYYSCPPAITNLANELKEKDRKGPHGVSRFDVSGEWWHEISPKLSRTDANLEDFMSTALIMWNPPTTFKYLFGSAHQCMPCPTCGWEHIREVINYGWQPHGPRRVYDLDRCIWLYGKRYKCKRCASHGRKNYTFASYDEGSMAHLARLPKDDEVVDASFIIHQFPVVLSRKAAVTNQVLDVLLHGLGTGQTWGGLSHMISELHHLRFSRLHAQYISYEVAYRGAESLSGHRLWPPKRFPQFDDMTVRAVLRIALSCLYLDDVAFHINHCQHHLIHDACIVVSVF